MNIKTLWSTFRTFLYTTVVTSALFSLTSCSLQTPPEDLPEEASAPPTAQAELSIVWEGTRVTTATTAEGTALAWEVNDVVNLAVEQDGITHYMNVSVSPTDNPRRAKVKFSCPGVDFTRPYNLCGFVGGAKWQNTNPAATPMVELNRQTALLPSLNSIAGVITCIFGAENLTTQSPTVKARMVGNIYKLSIESYQQTSFQISALGLSAANAVDKPFYDQAATTVINPYTGNMNGTSTDRQLFTLSAPEFLGKGERKLYYAYLLTTPQAKGTRVRPAMQSNGSVIQEDPSIHTMALPTMGTSIRRVSMVKTNKGLYTKTPQKPTLPADLTGPDKLSPYLNKWMSLYPNNYPLIKLFVPGTHDTEAVKLNIFQSFSQCQETHLADQLNKGVRAVDIRLYVANDGKLWVAHGSTYTWIEFEADVLKVMLNFLDNHPTETIFFMVKDERNQGGSWVQKILGYIRDSKYYNRFATNFTPKTTLGEVRGKIILLSRNTLNGLQIGIDFRGWGDNENHEAFMYSYKTGEVYELWSQDMYKSISASEKADLVKITLQESIDRYYKGIWTINYSSLSGNPGTNAKAINPRIADYLKNAKTPFYGLLYTDFITRGGDTQGPELMKQILWNQLKFLTR